jgi:hypothetical protein
VSETFPYEHPLPTGWYVDQTPEGYYLGTDETNRTPACTSKWQARLWVYRITGLPVPPPVQQGTP